MDVCQSDKPHFSLSGSDEVFPHWKYRSKSCRNWNFKLVESVGRLLVSNAFQSNYLFSLLLHGTWKIVFYFFFFFYNGRTKGINLRLSRHRFPWYCVFGPSFFPHSVFTNNNEVGKIKVLILHSFNYFRKPSYLSLISYFRLQFSQSWTLSLVQIWICDP